MALDNLLVVTGIGVGVDKIFGHAIIPILESIEINNATVQQIGHSSKK
jgi:hypothetical protein